MLSTLTRGWVVLAAAARFANDLGRQAEAMEAMPTDGSRERHRRTRAVHAAGVVAAPLVVLLLLDA